MSSDCLHPEIEEVELRLRHLDDVVAATAYDVDEETIDNAHNTVVPLFRTCL